MQTVTLVLTLATFLSGLMAGFLFGFAVVVMPGIRKLADREFLRSFQAMDRVIQKSQPLFMAMWLGSTLTLIVAAVMVLRAEGDLQRVLVIGAALASIVGIQLPTMTINIPLNNRVQSLDLDGLDETALKQEREAFEPRWNRWNVRRTVVSCAILIALLVALVDP